MTMWTDHEARAASVPRRTRIMRRTSSTRIARRTSTLWTVALLSAAVSGAVTAANSAPGAAVEPVGVIQGDAHGAVPDSYLVVLKPTGHLGPNTGQAGERVGEVAAAALTQRYGGTVARAYRHALNGFELAASEAVARRIAADPAVAWVERNSVVRIAPQDVQPSPPSWGLDRIDQRNLPLDDSYTYPNTGAGVRVYVFGTGIRFTHVDFGGRAISGRDVIDNDDDASDCNGVSTHLAGTVGGTQYGVAKEVTLVAVRNVNCQGAATVAQVIAGIDWVTTNAIKPAVALLTIGGPASSALDTAVQNSINSGVSYVVGAGQSNSDACQFSPARLPAAITVSATDMTDTRAGFANFGPCVDLFAPGVSITSAWYTSDTASAVLSGTSSAAAHVAGAAALILADAPDLTPAQVAAAIVANATTGVVNNPGPGSPNRLLFVNTGTAPSPCSGTNSLDIAIPDAPGPAITSTITIAGCSRAPSTMSTVEVHIRHTFRGDLVIDLLAPDGSAYRLQNRNQDSGDDLHATYVVNLSGESANGAWRLRVRDRRAGDIGTLDSWTLRL